MPDTKGNANHNDNDAHAGSGPHKPREGRERHEKHERHEHHEHSIDTEGLPAAIVVEKVSDVTRSMRRIRFAGPAVAGYLSRPRVPNVKLFFPDGPVLDLPKFGERGRYAYAPGQRERVRTYTVRAYSVEESWMDVDFVRHGAGLASSWAESARPGDVVGAVGGGGRLPRACDWILLMADDTGVPALAAILETLPEEQRGVALIEVDAEADEQPLACPPGVNVRWLHRRGTDPAASGLLTEAGSALELPSDLDGVFAWVSAESHVVRDMRKDLRERGVPRRNQLIIGYWHAGRAESEYSAESNHDRVADESMIVIPEASALAADSLGRAMRSTD